MSPGYATVSDSAVKRLLSPTPTHAGTRELDYIGTYRLESDGTWKMDTAAWFPAESSTTLKGLLQ